MKSTTELKNACIAEIDRCIEVAEKHYGITVPKVPVMFNPRLTSCGGKAVYRSLFFTPVRIELSLPLLLLNTQEFIDQVPAHEIAHIIDVVVNKRSSSHGYSWGSIMRLLGKEPERTHNMETPLRKSRKTMVAYCKCSNPEHKVTPQKMEKIKRGSTYCTTCRAYLTLTKPVVITVPETMKMNPECLA
jgi:SprT protein